MLKSTASNGYFTGRVPTGKYGNSDINRNYAFIVSGWLALVGVVVSFVAGALIGGTYIHRTETATYLAQGDSRYARGDYDGAILNYTEAIRFSPELASAYYGRGIARAARGDSQAAIADLTEAIRLNPQDTQAYYQRGLEPHWSVFHRS